VYRTLLPCIYVIITALLYCMRNRSSLCEQPDLKPSTNLVTSTSPLFLVLPCRQQAVTWNFAHHSPKANIPVQADGTQDGPNLLLKKCICNQLVVLKK
jgi:hypothetical protein